MNRKYRREGNNISQCILYLVQRRVTIMNKWLIVILVVAFGLIFGTSLVSADGQYHGISYDTPLYDDLFESNRWCR
jgi:hypothetical protein